MSHPHEWGNVMSKERRVEPSVRVVHAQSRLNFTPGPRGAGLGHVVFLPDATSHVPHAQRITDV